MSVHAVHRLLVAAVPLMPRPLVWQFSRRYIAGTRLEDAFRSVQVLNAAGCTATIDVLGEDSTRAAQVDAAAGLYLQALDGIRDAGLDCNISVKLSEMGLRFDRRLCLRTMFKLADAGAQQGNFLRIDMEDSSVTAATLDIYRRLRENSNRVGVVIQACLRRSAQDVADLLRRGIANIRLCKGIYIEPEAIAFRAADDVRTSFQRLLEELFAGSAEKVGIATHDPELVAHAERAIRDFHVPKRRYEFQMLLGVAGRLRDELVRKGHPVRVYVPFGELWFNYSLRRLRENPQLAGHIIGNLLKR